MTSTRTDRERDLDRDLDYVDERPAYRGPATPRDSGGGPWVAIAIVIGALALGVALWALLDDDTSAGPEIGVTADDVVSEPAQFLGETVTVSGEATDFVAGDSTGSGPGGFRLADELPVVVAPNADAITDAPLSTGDVVRVTGTVETFVVAEFESDFGVGFDDPAWAQFEREAVLVADAIRIIDPAQPAEATPGDVVASEIVNAPESFYGRSVRIESVVTDTLGANAFAVEEGELLVVGETTGDIDTGNVVDVNGVVREFDEAAIEQETGMLLEDGLFDEWAGRPAIVAENVTAAAGDS